MEKLNKIELPEGINTEGMKLEDYVNFQIRISDQKTRTFMAISLLLGIVVLVLGVFIFGILYADDKSSIITATFTAIGGLIGVLPSMAEYFFPESNQTSKSQPQNNKPDNV